MVAGSGIKPTPQKGQGRSRQGNKRAPQRKGGGVTHGPVPRALGFPINNKLRLLALKTLLSAKLFEDRLIFIDSEAIEYPKTQLLEAIVEPYGADKLCFVTPSKVDNNFSLAAQNLQNIKVKNVQEFNLPDMLMADYIFLTKDSMLELEEILDKRQSNYYRNRKISRPEHIEFVKAKKQDHFERDIMLPILNADQLESDEKLLQLQTASLKNYIDDLRSIQQKAQE